MIYGFVRQSNGAVRIESELGAGTTVEIVLPRYTGNLISANVVDASEDDAHSEQGEVILVVEDESVIRQLIVETLEDLGYRMLEAADGSAALRILQSPQRIDLLVTDIGLPGLNGRQLADAARTGREKTPGSLYDRLCGKRGEQQISRSGDGDHSEAFQHEGLGQARR